MKTSITLKTVVQDEGINVPSNNVIDFTGQGVTVTTVDGKATVIIPGPTVLTGLTYKGPWDASTNTPILTSGVGTPGDYYIVTKAGTTNLDGITDWQVGDWAIFDTTVWFKIDNHDIQAYNTVKNESSILPQRSILKFTGDGVTATDLSGETVITIPGNIPNTNYGFYSQTSNSTVITNSVLESSLVGTGVGTLTVPANGFNIGDSFQLNLGGIISSKNNETIRIKLKVGSIILLDTGLQTLPVITNDIWQCTFNGTVRTLGLPGTASINILGVFHTIKSANNNQTGFAVNNLNSTTFDTTISNTLEVTIQWGSANVANSIYSTTLILNKIY